MSSPNPGGNDDSANRDSPKGNRSQKFVYPIRSLLGPIQPAGEQDILEALLSPPILSTQPRLSEPSDSQYFPEVSSSTQAQQSPGLPSLPSEEGFSFKHYPGVDGTRSFITSAEIVNIPKSPKGNPRQLEDSSSQQPAAIPATVPYQVQERVDSKDEVTVIREVEVQAPQPIHPKSQMTESFQSVLDDTTPTREDDTEPPMAVDGSKASSQAGDEAGSITESFHTGQSSRVAHSAASNETSERDFSASGLVHLAPAGSAETLKRTNEWRGKVGSGSEGVSTGVSSQLHGAGGSSIPPKIDEDPGETREAPKSSSFSVTTRSSQRSGPVVTMRFEHKEDADGHHVLIGREGNLTRCEDEPIRIPGAVQGFGVLIVLHDDRSTGQMKVRQVSENSKIILGLSPKYLFGLDCFTNILPPTQADLLWDSIQFLDDPDYEEDDEDESPQVFLLSGWGEPGSAFEDSEDPEKRRQWTCWVAAHRLRHKGGKQPEEAAPTGQLPARRLIVVEFELENDYFNPLYPLPVTPSDGRSDESSPVPSGNSGGIGSGGGSGSGTGSAQTLNEATKSTPTLTPGGSTGQSSDNATPQPKIPNVSKTGETRVVTREQPGQVESQEEEWMPSTEAILSSTTSRSRPLKALERMRRFNRTGNTTIQPYQSPRSSGVGTMDVFTILQQVNEQLGKALDLLELLEIVVGVVKDLTQFHRVLCYQFDDAWNGQVIAELVDWGQTRDLYKGLHFPAADIPPQARELYVINRVRLLYDRSQSTARLVVKDRSDLEPPLDMTHCFLRAMSPIHIKYLGNMGVRASMSISIVAFQKLWGLIACHSYGNQGMRVSFPVRQMLRLLSDSISRNVERLSYAQRLRTRKLISTVPTDQHPTGYIVSNSEDLLTLFDADSGVLVIGEGAKILGPNENGQDILLLAEYLRVKQFTLLQVSQSLMADYPDLQLPSGLDVIAGLLYVPLSLTGKDFIALLRRGQADVVNWAGRPPTKTGENVTSLEPRTSFSRWKQMLTGRCRPWRDEQLDTAAVLALVYGKFIEVWRQKESAVQMNQMTSLLLSNASHEVRTPLHQIINYLELALDGNGSKLDPETRENLTRSHAASKALLFTINDLLDLTRLEAGKETSFNEPFDLHLALQDACKVYKVEAARRRLDFQIDLGNAPRYVVGDARKIKTVVANLTSNAVKYTNEGSVAVTAHTFEEPEGLRALGNVAVEIVISDTGIGIQPEKLESIFREFEQVENDNKSKTSSRTGLGLGLAVVARVIEQLGGQLRVDSKIGEGSRFSCLFPFPIADTRDQIDLRSSSAEDGGSGASNTSEIDSLVEAISASHMIPHRTSHHPPPRRPKPRKVRAPVDGKFEVEDSVFPIRPIRVDRFDLDKGTTSTPFARVPRPENVHRVESKPIVTRRNDDSNLLRILVVEDDLVNSRVLKKRLVADGHEVHSVVNGQQAVNLIETDRDFDCVLMDIQMPILDGFGATEGIRAIEQSDPKPDQLLRRSIALVGRIPIFAVSASLTEDQRDYMIKLGMDGWILKPIEFKRMAVLLGGITKLELREANAYYKGCSWEAGGWLQAPANRGLGADELSPEPDPSPSSGDAGATTASSRP